VWIVLPLLIAQALHARVPGWRFFRIVFFLPAVLSPVVLGVYYGLVLRLDGVVNAALRKIHLGGWARDWLNDPNLAFAIVTLVLMWATFGLGVLIYLAGLSTLDDEVLEAARVDGASPLQVERHIIVWLMMPVIRFWSLIIFIAAFTGVFPLIFSLTRGGPGFATYMIEFDIYDEAFSNGALGYSSAIGIVLLAFVATLIGLLSRVLGDRVG
jgi:ABC-type sugar transport system permease subunit